MRLQKLAAFIIPLTVLACGGSSLTAPTSTAGHSAPPATTTDIAAGAYVLTVAMAQHGAPTCDSNGICVSISLCSGAGGPTSAPALTTGVCVERSGDAILVRPDDAAASFRMELRIAAGTVSGAASGQFRDSSRQLSLVAGSGQSPAIVTGTVLPASVAGRFDGQIAIGGYSCSNNGHTWTLVPR